MVKKTQEIEVRKKEKKLDWIIYLLAFISLVLMVVVIVSNNKTDIKITDIKPIITDMAQKDKTVKTEEIEPKSIEPKEIITKKEETKEDIIKKDATEVTKEDKKEEIIKKEETIKKDIKAKEEKVEKKEEIKVKSNEIDYKNYNWKALKRYKAKPDKNLYVVSEYKVQNGDALWKIAKKMGVRTINIIAVNNSLTNPNLILPGQVILIPNK